MFLVSKKSRECLPFLNILLKAILNRRKGEGGGEMLIDEEENRKLWREKWAGCVRNENAVINELTESSYHCPPAWYLNFPEP